MPSITQVNQAANNASPPFDIAGTPFIMGGTRDAGTNRNTTASYARVQVYDTVLSAAQRDELYNQLVAAPSELPPPLAHYSFNDGTASDSSSNGLDGMLQGGAEVVEDDERGQVLALNLDDADDDYVTIDDPNGLLDFSGSGPHEGSATTMAWVKSGIEGDWTVHTTIFSQGEWDDGISLSLKGDVDPDGQIWVAGDGTHAVVHRSDTAPSTLEWHHVAVTFDFDGLETLITMYIDGEKTGFSQGDGITPVQVSAPVNGMSRIGLEDRSGDGSLARWGYNGYLDDLRISMSPLPRPRSRPPRREATVPGLVPVRSRRGATPPAPTSSSPGGTAT